MTGRELIDTIQKYHLEDLDIFPSGIELPYPEYKDVLFDAPAYIYRRKVLVIDDEGNSKWIIKELDTRK